MKRSDRQAVLFRQREFWHFALHLCTTALLVLTACRPASQLAPTATPTPSATAIPSATLTLSPTATPTVAPPLTSTAPASPVVTRAPMATARAEFDGERAYELVIEQVEFGYRPTGSEAGRATGDWIIDQLSAAGWQTESQEFTYLGVACRNILGRIPGNGELPVVLLGAHYDTRRRADQDAERPSEPVMGANDGASGTAVLLELAHALEAAKTPYQVWLVFFDAEDNGHLDGWDWIVGSTYFAWRLAVRPEFVIIVDMVGDTDQQIYYEQNSDPALMQALWQTASDLGYGDTIIPEYRHAMLDDHTPFLRLGIRAVDMIDFDYPYWHTTADTADKVSADSLERVGRTVEVFLETASVAPLQ